MGHNMEKNIFFTKIHNFFKQHKKITAFLVFAVCMLGIGGIIFLVNKDYFENQKALRTMTPDEYYKWAATRNADKNIQIISDAYTIAEGLVNFLSSDSEYEYLEDIISIILDKSSQLSDNENFRKFTVRIDFAEDFSSDIGIPLLQSAAFSFDHGKLDTYNAYKISFLYNGSSLLSAYILVDEATGCAYFNIPEYNDYYLAFSLDNAISASTVTYQDIASLFKMINETVIPMEDFKTILSEYSYYIINAINDVAIKKGVTITDSNNNSITGTQISFTLTFKDILSILDGLFDKIKNDDILASYAIDYGLYNSKLSYRAGVSSLSVIAFALFEKYEDTGEIHYTRVIDNKGNIVYKASDYSIYPAEDTFIAIRYSISSVLDDELPQLAYYKDGNIQFEIKASYEDFKDDAFILPPKEDKIITSDNYSKYLDIPDLFAFISNNRDVIGEELYHAIFTKIAEYVIGNLITPVLPTPSIAPDDTPSDTPTPELPVTITVTPTPEATPTSAPVATPSNAPSPTPEPDIDKYSDFPYHGYIKLGQYKNLSISNQPEEVTEADVDSYIDEYLNVFMDWYAVDFAADGDIILMNYKVKYDDILFNYCDNYEFTFESDILPEEIREQLYDVKTGTVLELDYVLPKEYNSYSGFIGTYEIEILGIFRYMKPELTDRFVQQHFGALNVSTYRDSVKNYLTALAHSEFSSDVLTRIIKKITRSSSIITYPHDEIEAAKAELLEFYSQFAASLGMTDEEFAESSFNMSLEEFYTVIDETAAESIIYEMILYAVIEAEDIDISSVSDDTIISYYTAEYGYQSHRELLKNYSIDTLRKTYLLEYAKDFLLENNPVAEN